MARNRFAIKERAVRACVTAYREVALLTEVVSAASVQRVLEHKRELSLARLKWRGGKRNKGGIAALQKHRLTCAHAWWYIFRDLT